jgi:hypothetical protein
MNNFQNVSETPNSSEPAIQVPLWQAAQAKLRGITLKKLRGGLLVLVGYLLSPLCWWNDLLFNLPVAYAFGYICSLFSSNLFMPGLIAGYWLSNIIGILLMQLGTADILQGQQKEKNFKKELLMGVASSTLYTAVIVALVQFKVLDTPSFFTESSLADLNSLLQRITFRG